MEGELRISKGRVLQMVGSK